MEEDNLIEKTITSQFYSLTDEEKDFVKKITKENKQIETNNPNILNECAFYFYQNNEFTKMKDFYLKSISLNNSYGMYCLAKYYIFDKKHENYSVDLFRRAADLCNIKSIRELIIFYKHRKNEEEMVKYLKLAIKNGDVISMNSLGYYYYLQKNYSEMITYYKMAIENNYIKSINNLAYYYKYNELNFVEMVRYFQLGMERGSIDSMLGLGHYYQEEKNIQEMKRCYLAAADLGSAEAALKIAKYFREVEKDIPQMLKYCKIAIDQGNSLAMLYLGNYYHFVEKNFEEMKKFTILAAEKGEKEAIYNLKFYYTLIEKNEEDAMKYGKMVLPFIDDDDENYFLNQYRERIERNDGWLGWMKKFIPSK